MTSTAIANGSNLRLYVLGCWNSDLKMSTIYLLGSLTLGLGNATTLRSLLRPWEVCGGDDKEGVSGKCVSER